MKKEVSTETGSVRPQDSSRPVLDEHIPAQADAARYIRRLEAKLQKAEEAIQLMKSRRYTISVPETARRMGISKPTAYILVRRADFPAFSIGDRTLVYDADLVDWIRKQARNHAKIALDVARA